jgi:hypothetical protein
LSTWTTEKVPQEVRLHRGHSQGAVSGVSEDVNGEVRYGLLSYAEVQPYAVSQDFVIGRWYSSGERPSFARIPAKICRMLDMNFAENPIFQALR